MVPFMTGMRCRAMLTWNGLVGSTALRIISMPICSPLGPRTMMLPWPLLGSIFQPVGTPMLAELSDAVTRRNATEEGAGALLAAAGAAANSALGAVRGMACTFNGLLSSFRPRGNGTTKVASPIMLCMKPKNETVPA